MRKSMLVKALLAAALFSLVIAVPVMGAGLNTGAGPWQWLRPPVQGATINDMDFTDVNTGWAVGIGGTILKTTDGGASWASQISGTNYNLWGVDFVDADHGWAVGDYGTVIYTTDGGATWNTQSLPSSPAYPMLEDVSFYNGNAGVITGGGYGYYTSNGGATWSKTGSINTLHSLASVQMTSATTAVAVGNGGVIYKTVDGGATWSMPSSPTSSDISSVYFIDINRGMAVASVGASGGRLLRTTDGGDTWVASSDGQVTTPLYTVSVIDDNGPWAVTAAGRNGALFKYSSSGATDIWSSDIDVVAAALNAGALSSGTTSNLIAMAFPTGQTGFIGGGGGAISKSTDYGASWSLIAGGDAVNLLGSTFPDAQNGWMAGNDATVIKTTDSGETWAEDTTCSSCPGGILPGDIDFQDIDFTSTSSGVAVGCQGSGCPGSGTAVAYKYSSGNWSPATVPGGVLLYAVHMVDASNGWAVGSGSTALRTSDGGATWVSATNGLPAGADLVDVDAISAGGSAWAAGQDISGTGKGAMFRWDGATWSQFNPASAPTFLTGIDMIDASTGYVSGSGGKIYKTTDGGVSWTEQVSGTSKLLADISFSSATNGFAIGDEGRLIHTRDGGATWSAEDLGTNVSMFTVSVLGERTAFAGGGNGSVLRALRPYYFTWYDDLYSDNWILMANPATASGNLFFDLFIAGRQQDLSNKNNGEVAPGVSIDPKYAGVIGGPVNAASLTSDKAIVSQRILWPKGGSSIEEVLGQDIERLSNHYYWTWYDQQSPGYTNWILIANPNPYSVDYEIRIGGNSVATGTIASGDNTTPTFPGTIGGPVEVIATVAGTSDPAFVMASQRVLSNYGSAFNEAPGIPVDELSSDYYWPWYDDVGGKDWILIANPPGAANPIDYEIYIGGNKVCDSNSCNNTNGAITPGPLAAGQSITPRFGSIDGPVEVKTFIQGTTTPAVSIASQRIVIGPSFGETMGYPVADLSSTYHWTWYDELSPGMRNWVLIANESGGQVNCDIKIAGTSQDGWPKDIPDGENRTPEFPGHQGGPVEVSCDGPVIASQRVVYNGYFNEVLGTVLN